MCKKVSVVQNSSRTSTGKGRSGGLTPRTMATTSLPTTTNTLTMTGRIRRRGFSRGRPPPAAGAPAGYVGCSALLLFLSALLSGPPGTGGGHYPLLAMADLIVSSGLQPRVTAVEDEFPQQAYSSLSAAEGTPWCGGRPTYWMLGHNWEPYPEAPHCYNSEDNTWTRDSSIATLDYEDDKSRSSGWKKIDRHGCVAIDANNDGIPDVACVVGANFARDFGYSELYLTQESDGSLQKVLSHGLQQYPSMSSRWIVAINGPTPQSSKSVFVTTSAAIREDGLTNKHRMFRVLGAPPYFQEVPGPWTATDFPIGNEPLAADVDGDGVDDLVTFSWEGRSHIYLQNSVGGGWTEVELPVTDLVSYWSDARIGYVSNSARPDLVVTWGDLRGPGDYYVHVFRWIPEAPYFDFRKPIFSQRLGNSGIGVEILDANADNRADIYVSVANWDCDKSTSRVPTVDRSRDLLLVGRGRDPANPAKLSFDRVQMESKLRGCGGLVKKFGNDQTLVLAEGSHFSTGYGYLLEWGDGMQSTG